MANAILKTPPGTLTFAHLFKPAPVMQGSTGDPQHEVTLVLKPAAQKTAEYKALVAAVDEATNELATELKVKPSQLRSPFRDGSERSEKYAGFEDGDVFFAAKSKFKPEVFNENNELVTDPDAVFAGQEGRLAVAIKKYNYNGNRGIGFYLQGVKITDSDKPRLDGRPSGASLWGDDDAAF